MFQGFALRPLLKIFSHKAKLNRGIIILVLVFAASLLFFCLSLALAGSPSSDRLPDKGDISETNIQFEADQSNSLLQGEEYYVNYRLAREQCRQEVKGMLEALLNSPDVQNMKAAQKKWLDLSTKIAQESELESLLKIKGFQDVIADVNYDSVNIIVLTEGLTPNAIFLIQDTVTRVTGVRSERISVSIRK